MMDAEALSRLMREAPAVNSVNLTLDRNARDAFYTAVKGLPTVAGAATASLVTFGLWIDW